jgi:hypothetical protein
MTDDPAVAADEGPGRYPWLQKRLFPAIIAYTTHPLHILALLALWIGLLLFHDTLFELVGGNYTNGLSAMAASIVLLQQMSQHRETKRLHRQHHELLTEVRELVRSRPSPTAE